MYMSFTANFQSVLVSIGNYFAGGSGARSEKPSRRHPTSSSHKPTIRGIKVYTKGYPAKGEFRCGARDRTSPGDSTKVLVSLDLQFRSSLSEERSSTEFIRTHCHQLDPLCDLVELSAIVPCRFD